MCIQGRLSKFSSGDDFDDVLVLNQALAAVRLVLSLRKDQLYPHFSQTFQKQSASALRPSFVGSDGVLNMRKSVQSR